MKSSITKPGIILGSENSSRPRISVVIPSRNENERIRDTLVSIDSNRSSNADIEIVIVDDASESPVEGFLANLSIRAKVSVIRSESRQGVPVSRNIGCYSAQGETLVITDAHVQFPEDWDKMILPHVQDDRILVGSIVSAPKFKACGCRLVVPYMGTWWNGKLPERLEPVQVAPCSATVLPNELFKRLGGYDSGMRMYGAAEPEFSVRAWLAGAQILALPEFELKHAFKDKDQRNDWVNDHRTDMVHNGIRFGLLYLSRREILRMIRHYAMAFPDHMQHACKLLSDSDVWNRRAELQDSLKYRFDWYIKKFSLLDQVGRPIFD